MATTGTPCRRPRPAAPATTTWTSPRVPTTSAAPRRTTPTAPAATRTRPSRLHMNAISTPNNPDVPSGAVNFTYVINTFTVTNNIATVNFQILADGLALTTLHTTYPPTGFTGGPSFLLAYSLPQAGITEPADGNNRGTHQAQPRRHPGLDLHHARACGRRHLRCRPDHGALPAGATMRAVGMNSYFTQVTRPGAPRVGADAGGRRRHAPHRRCGLPRLPRGPRAPRRRPHTVGGPRPASRPSA